MFRWLKQINFTGTNKSLLKHSMISNTIFGFFLRGSGDLIQQTIEKNNQTLTKHNRNKSNYFDWNRTSK